MKSYLREILSSNENGLFLCELPTGYGKTYNSAKLIAEFVRYKADKRKIIFLTTLNKNLPEEELRSALGCDLYEESVLRIRSNFDEVVEKFLTLEVPEDFQTERYNRLSSCVQKYLRVKENGAADKEYIRDLEERVRSADSVFRKEITVRLRKAFSSKQARLNAIKRDPQYKWIGKLYPAVFTDDFRVLLMSVNKFLTRNSVLTEPSYEFLNAPFLDNAIVFIDEFDATKATVKTEIIKRSLGMKNDFLVLFRQLYRMLDTQSMSLKLRSSCQKTDGENIKKTGFADILREAEDIDKKYHTNLSYKTLDEAVDRRQNFLLKDSSFHTILQGNASYIRANVNPAENIVDIRFESKEEYYGARSKEDIVIYGMIRDINAFLRHFKDFLFEWARHYCEEENENRVDGRDLMTLENAVSSIMDRLDLSLSQRGLLLGELCEPLVWLEKDDVIPAVSFYQDGMEIYEFEDSDVHNDSTEINFIKVYDTPEKLMIYLARKCKVVGISATAEIPTAVGNYNLNYLAECLGEHFHPTPNEVTERIRREIEPGYRAYADGRISLITKVLSADYNGEELSVICRLITGEDVYSVICANLITAQSVERFQSVRYCNAFCAMLEFCRHSIQSMLYLGMALPKDNHPDFDEGLMQKLMNLAVEFCGLDSESCRLFVLRSDDFEQQKEALLKLFAEGKKVFVMSSYNTLGAGQNLQYPIDNPQDYVCLRECDNPADKRFFTKDIDAVYLGDTTNLTVNTYSDKAIGENSLMEMLFQIEELYNNGEFNYADKDRMIRLAFNKFSGGIECYNVLYDAPSVKMQATKYVIQAIGRMCRTFVKNREIYIFAEEKLLDKLSAGEINRRITPPEMKRVAMMCGEIATVYTADENRLLNNAERISTVGMQSICSILSRTWTKNSMAVWQQLRETVLRYPTAPTEIHGSNSTVKKLYITSGKKQNNYLYSQYSDYSNVTLDFSGDEIGFRNSRRAKRKGNTDEVAVYHMNEQESGLTAALKYNGMKEYFNSKGFALSFENNEYLLSPVLFHNIYKGALGEVCGEFILRRERGIVLKPIEDADRFEFFDFELGNGVYVDFKNWKQNYLKDRQKSLDEISRKLDAIGGKRVYIINLFHHEGVKPTVSDGGRIVEIPGLIDGNGGVVGKHLDYIKEEDYAADESV